ncbi:MAG: HDIG domain-containing protein [Anaerolineae bacterium]|nr:HDIG domain-containing protein [Anaerolineae bacterium]
MIDWLEGLLQRYFQLPPSQTHGILHIVGLVVAAGCFVLISTVIVAYDSLFPSINNLASLQVGDAAPQDIRAPMSVPPFVSTVLTEQRQQEVRAQITPIYFPPDPAISRQQVDQAAQILDYIDNIRHDPYGSAPQRAADLRQIDLVRLDDEVITQLLDMDDRSWSDVRDQIKAVLERVMQGEIRDNTVDSVIAQLPMQVSVRFTEEQSAVVVALLRDLVRPNTVLNADATESARAAAAADVSVRRSFERGQIIVRAGETVDAAAYEALDVLGLLEPTTRRVQDIIRAILVSNLVLVIAGLYVARFRIDLFKSSRMMALLAAIFLLLLFGARISGLYGQLDLYPTAALAMLFVALVGAEMAVLGSLGLAALIGLMQAGSLESAMFVGVGGMMAALTLRRPERLNGYFMPGIIVSLANVAVLLVFYQGALTSGSDVLLGERLIYAFINGLLAAAVALAGIYVVTVLFNLPTGMKLVELSQPNQPLLQRVLREAPGTYQHSLQVANLSEQAANSIGANADLVRVAALYHDVGKMMNPAFFTENQVEGINPHDTLDDPARSAALIISHVTDGEKLARQYHLPTRLRDFILEHHGTQVLYFYQQALQRAGEHEVVDIEQFTYPGPKPQSRETAILMLADSCEAAVRSRKPTRKQDIADTIQQIIDSKIQTGQLDESGLTLNDIRTIRKTFAEMLQAVFHPRINYPVQTKPAEPSEAPAGGRTLAERIGADAARPVEVERGPVTLQSVEASDAPRVQTKDIPVITLLVDDNDDTPLADVPPLPRAHEPRPGRFGTNGQQPVKKDGPEEQ